MIQVDSKVPNHLIPWNYDLGLPRL